MSNSNDFLIQESSDAYPTSIKDRKIIRIFATKKFIRNCSKQEIVKSNYFEFFSGGTGEGYPGAFCLSTSIKSSTTKKFKKI